MNTYSSNQSARSLPPPRQHSEHHYLTSGSAPLDERLEHVLTLVDEET